MFLLSYMLSAEKLSYGCTYSITGTYFLSQWEKPPTSEVVGCDKLFSVGVQSPTEITLREDAHACGQEDDAFGIPHAARKSRKRDLNLWDREWEQKGAGDCILWRKAYRNILLPQFICADFRHNSTRWHIIIIVSVCLSVWHQTCRRAESI